MLGVSFADTEDQTKNAKNKGASMPKEFRTWHYEIIEVKQRGLPIHLKKYIRVYDDKPHPEPEITPEDRGAISHE